ncbi:hypothetical protein [Gayadomonas joobiniege]|uniref:hypothetical protein n=1 Tax=Gayadomonas joobiniege TaxID=1234606 RepID=UPI0003821B37|nr:hypothetical protein [Gayadomonas joobiniege]
MFFRLNKKHLFNLVSLSLLSLQGIAAEVNFSGFMNVSATYENSDEFEYSTSFLSNRRDGFSIAADSSVGLQMEVSFSHEFDTVIQLVLDDSAETSLNNYIELAFARYRINRNLTARIGRINSNGYLLSEFKPVSYAYPWIRPPKDYYAHAAVVSNIDGADLQYRNNLGPGFITVTGQWGQSKAAMYDDKNRVNLTVDSIIVASVQYEIDYWLFKASSAQIDFGEYDSVIFSPAIKMLNTVPVQLWPDRPLVVDSISTTDKSMTYSALAIQFDDAQWILQAEFGINHSNWALNAIGHYGYASLAYRVDQITPYFRAGFFNPDATDLNYELPELGDAVPEQQQMQLAYLINGINNELQQKIDQNSLTLGARWDFFPGMALKVQADHYDIGKNGSNLWPKTERFKNQSSASVTVFSVSWNWVF